MMKIMGTGEFIPKEDGEIMPIKGKKIRWRCKECGMGPCSLVQLDEPSPTCRVNPGNITRWFWNYIEDNDMWAPLYTLEWVDDNCPTPINLRNRGIYLWLYSKPVPKTPHVTPSDEPCKQRLDNLEKQIQRLEVQLEHHIDSKHPFYRGLN